VLEENKLKIIFTTLLALLMSEISIADGNSLLERCKKAETSIRGDGFYTDEVSTAFGAGYCAGVVRTYRQRLQFIYGVEKPGYLDKTIIPCSLPEGVTDQQLVRVLVKFLEKHPEKLHYWEAYFIENAFREAFPCKVK